MAIHHPSIPSKPTTINLEHRMNGSRLLAWDDRQCRVIDTSVVRWGKSLVCVVLLLLLCRIDRFSHRWWLLVRGWCDDRLKTQSTVFEFLKTRSFCCLFSRLLRSFIAAGLQLILFPKPHLLLLLVGRPTRQQQHDESCISAAFAAVCAPNGFCS